MKGTSSKADVILPSRPGATQLSPNVIPDERSHAVMRRYRFFPMRPATLFLVCFFATFLSAQEPYTRVLIPIGTTDIAGANGLRWETRLEVFNGSQQDLEPLPSRGPCPDQCAAQAPCPIQCPFLPFTPGRTRDYALWAAARYGEPRALLLHLPADQAPHVGFSLRVSEVSRGSVDDFVDVPVVREQDMRTDPIRLLHVLNTRSRAGIPYRLALRIYALPETATPQVDVRILSLSGTVLGTHRLELVVRPPENGLQIFPSELTWAGFETALPTDPFIPNVTVEIVPVTAGLRIWAFITQTHNQTQRVALITPQ